jgi:hypothetical protein
MKKKFSPAFHQTQPRMFLFFYYFPLKVPISVYLSNSLTCAFRTIGKFARMLLIDHSYFGTMLKRNPIPLVREFQIKVRRIPVIFIICMRIMF